MQLGCDRYVCAMQWECPGQATKIGQNGNRPVINVQNDIVMETNNLKLTRYWKDFEPFFSGCRDIESWDRNVLRKWLKAHHAAENLSDRWQKNDPTVTNVSKTRDQRDQKALWCEHYLVMHQQQAFCLMIDSSSLSCVSQKSLWKEYLLASKFANYNITWFSLLIILASNN